MSYRSVVVLDRRDVYSAAVSRPSRNVSAMPYTCPPGRSSFVPGAPTYICWWNGALCLVIQFPANLNPHLPARHHARKYNLFHGMSTSALGARALGRRIRLIVSYRCPVISGAAAHPPHDAFRSMIPHQSSRARPICTGPEPG